MSQTCLFPGCQLGRAPTELLHAVTPEFWRTLRFIGPWSARISICHHHYTVFHNAMKSYPKRCSHQDYSIINTGHTKKTEILRVSAVRHSVATRLGLSYDQSVCSRCWKHKVASPKFAEQSPGTSQRQPLTDITNATNTSSSSPSSTATPRPPSLVRTRHSIRSATPSDNIQRKYLEDELIRVTAENRDLQRERNGAGGFGEEELAAALNCARDEVRRLQKAVAVLAKDSSDGKDGAGTDNERTVREVGVGG